LRHDLVARLLQDPRVQASINVIDARGNAILHYACPQADEPEGPAIIQLYLQAGADLTLKTAGGVTALYVLEQLHPTHPTTLALLEHSLDAEKASFLVKARRLVMAATRTTPPSSLQGRVAAGLPLPAVTLAPVMDDEKNEFRTMLAWLVGVEGGGMPRDVFRVVVELLMPFWDPLRRKVS